jgi:hypothetical protein
MILSLDVDNIIFYTENDWQVCSASLISHIMHVLPKAGRKDAGCHDAQKITFVCQNFCLPHVAVYDSLVLFHLEHQPMELSKLQCTSTFQITGLNRPHLVEMQRNSGNVLFRYIIPAY